MARTPSFVKAQDALAGLGLVLTPETPTYQGVVTGCRLWAYNPDAILALSKVKPTRLYDGDNDRTVGMVLLFDDEGKFAGANYSQLHWNDWDDTPGYEVRTGTSNWRADETTLKAAVSFLQGFSPVGSAQEAAEAQAAQEAEEKAEEERALNLAALNQTIIDNPDARRWAADVAEAAAYQRRRLVAELRDLAKKATEAANKAERGVRPQSLWFHASDALDIAKHMATLEALESTLEGPLAESIKAMAERYGY